MLSSWRIVRGRPRLFIGLLCGLVAGTAAAHGDQPHHARHPRLGYRRDRAPGAVGAFLFTTERLDRMAADAAAQEEGEWTDLLADRRRR